MRRLAIVCTHPVQYNAPWFRLLAERNKVRVKVFYTWGQLKSEIKYDPGFGKNIEWDIPLLEGYEYTFVRNTSKNPGSRAYAGINNPTLVHEIESWNPDAILVFGWNFRSHLKCLRYFHNKIPVLFRGDSTLSDKTPGLKSIVRRIALTWIYRHVDYALYVGKNNRQYFLKHGLRNDQLILAPHAVDNDRFSSGAASAEQKAGELREAMGIKTDEIVLLYAGKLEVKKDPGILIEAFVKITNERLHLVIVGDGKLKSELQKKFKDKANLHFYPFQNQSALPVFYKLCDVFILPSKGPGETWGLSVNEAMACEKPVIVSDKCGCAIDLVQEGKNGYTFRAGCVNDLAKKINLLLGKKQLKEEGLYSKHLISQWSFEQISEAIEKVITSLPNPKSH